MQYPTRSNINTIIIVMPHTLCDKNVINCEIYLLDFVNDLMKKFSSTHTHPKIYIIPSYQNRYILDDNRIIPTHNDNTILNSSQLWIELRTLFEKNNFDLKKVCILNLHTFFENNFSDYNNPNTNIAILDNNPTQPLSLKILYFFKKKKYNTNLLNGKFGYNALLDIFTIHPVYIPSILIEIKKDLITNRNSESYKKLINDFITLIIYVIAREEYNGYELGHSKIHEVKSNKVKDLRYVLKKDQT